MLPDGHSSGFDEVLEAQVVDAASGEDHVGTSGQDLVDPLLGDVGLTVPEEERSFFSGLK